ncbi:zinc ABC transporter substrate-binding protein [Halobacillus sp. A1]|uniref:metal ABC transporter solute-binding protein, Zn/Mn family n=1 Tax=Halobacillus sp. A1 TaxID=2880262 RepID=UPI0020A66073|nr:zinc ABC transporter substrate-binding protein [Halobacillus sp. A1]MCP3030188.1 zinc ABC transporter substrate-binding protein [Halobacillus sp. A1]
MNRTKIGLLILIIFLVLGACSEQTSEESSSDNEEKLKINTTVYPLQFFAQQIAGEAAEVNTILPPGTDAHSYEPTTKEMVEMAEADAFIYNGAGLETYAEKIADSIDSEDVKILEAANGIDLEGSGHSHDHEEEGHSEEDSHDHGEEGHSEEESHDHEEEGHSEEESHDHEEEGHSEEESHDHEEEGHSEEDHAHEEESSGEENHEGHNHGEQDPHVWLDPIRSIEMAENVKNMLVELEPDSEEQFNENFEELKAELESLDKEFHEQIESKEKKEIIVSHAAYGYWEQAYGIEQISVSGLSPTNEPSQKDLEEIISKSQEHDLNHVLFEQNITPKVSEVVQNEIGAEALRIHNLSVLTENDIEDEEDYFTLMERNLEVLDEALSE